MAKDLTFSFRVDQTPEEVFTAVNNVRGWWSEALEGNTEKQGDEFVYRYKDIHMSKQKLVEVIPNKKVIWLVTEGYLNFVNEQNEWEGTTISFDISRKGDKTELVFTHHGLTPQKECYEACNGGWSHYIIKSLLPLITTGKGIPAAPISEPENA